MESVERALRQHWQNIWVVPPRVTIPAKEGLPEHRGTEVFFSKSTANTSYLSAHGNKWSTYAWRQLPHRAVPFALEQPDKGYVLSKNAPLSMWVLFDLCNKEPCSIVGSAWVFLFNSRSDARKYKRALDAERKMTLRDFAIVFGPYLEDEDNEITAVPVVIEPITGT